MILWRKVWRAFAGHMSRAGLEALQTALETDDPRLIQGWTMKPAPLVCFATCEVEAACAVSLAGWRGDGLLTVSEVDEFFARMCFTVDEYLGESAGCRWFLNWYDETPREVMRQELLREVRYALGQRSDPEEDEG